MSVYIVHFVVRESYVRHFTTVLSFLRLFSGIITENEISTFPSTEVTSVHWPVMRDLKKKRILKFLRNFRLDFSKFDTTCIKREGRGLPAPAVSHARVVKYSRLDLFIYV